MHVQYINKKLRIELIDPCSIGLYSTSYLSQCSQCYNTDLCLSQKTCACISAGSILNIIEKFDTWLSWYRYFEYLVFSIISNVDTFDTWFNVAFAHSELTNKDVIIFVKA